MVWWVSFLSQEVSLSLLSKFSANACVRASGVAVCRKIEHRTVDSLVDVSVGQVVDYVSVVIFTEPSWDLVLVSRHPVKSVSNVYIIFFSYLVLPICHRGCQRSFPGPSTFHPWTSLFSWFRIRGLHHNRSSIDFSQGRQCTFCCWQPGAHTWCWRWVIHCYRCGRTCHSPYQRVAYCWLHRKRTVRWMCTRGLPLQKFNRKRRRRKGSRWEERDRLSDLEYRQLLVPTLKGFSFSGRFYYNLLFKDSYQYPQCDAINKSYMPVIPKLWPLNNESK